MFSKLFSLILIQSCYVMDRRTDVWTMEWMDRRWTDGHMGEYKDGWTDMCAEGRTEGWFVRRRAL